MPTVTSTLSRNSLRPGRDRQHPAVAARQVAGEEVEADQLHAGVLDGGDEGVDLARRAGTGWSGHGHQNSTASKPAALRGRGALAAAAAR